MLNICELTLCWTFVSSLCAEHLWAHSVLNICEFTLCWTFVSSLCAEHLWIHSVLNISEFTLCWTFVSSLCAKHLWVHSALNLCEFSLCWTFVTSVYAEHLWVSQCWTFVSFPYDEHFSSFSFTELCFLRNAEEYFWSLNITSSALNTPRMSIFSALEIICRSSPEGLNRRGASKNLKNIPLHPLMQTDLLINFHIEKMLTYPREHMLLVWMHY